VKIKLISTDWKICRWIKWYPNKAYNLQVIYVASSLFMLPMLQTSLHVHECAVPCMGGILGSSWGKRVPCQIIMSLGTSSNLIYQLKFDNLKGLSHQILYFIIGPLKLNKYFLNGCSNFSSFFISHILRAV
jgi:hypothetical protein